MQYLIGSRLTEMSAEESLLLLRQVQRQKQTLVQRIDPKLIMANSILQQNSFELVQRIEMELEENPALEALEDQSICNGNCIDPMSCPYCSLRLQNPEPVSSMVEMIDMEPDMAVDSLFDAEDIDIFGSIEAEITLHDHLLNQLHTSLPPADLEIGEYLISSINDNGWLDTGIDCIAQELGANLADVERVLRGVQSFDPPGIGARDLQECLLIQLQFLRDEGRPNEIAEKMIAGLFHDVVKRCYGRMARSLGITSDQARKTVEFIRKQLNPYPAAQYRQPWDYKPTNAKVAVRPDVIIRRTELGYEVEVPATGPMSLGINPTYREAYITIKDGKNGHMGPDEQKHITEFVERAELFIRNINQRRKTMRQITRCIIDLQQGFLETGSKSYIRPLTRTSLARMLDIHESTVSRATIRKFVQLPNQDVVPFEIFFNSSLAVKAAIEGIIANEDPHRPHSDREIMEILSEQGFDIARRTVVKYRDSQKLLSSNKRNSRQKL